MGPESVGTYSRLYPGEWIALSGGHVIAHGRDFDEVARRACRKALDIAFERLPDPRAPLWQVEPPATQAPRSVATARRLSTPPLGSPVLEH
jgi:hypothetical protein